jgi:hypothetical protein
MQPFNPHRPFLQDFESLGHYHDFWASVVLNAPDRFELSFLPTPIDQGQALADAFESLQRGLTLAKSKLKDERLFTVVSELLRMSCEFYLAGDRKQGIRSLQEAEGLIWPSRRVRLELAAAAEQRAFGALQLFKDLPARRFDGEGSIENLGPGQRTLFVAAHARAMERIRLRQDFKRFVLVLNRQGDVIEIKQSSLKKAMAEVERLAAAAEISALVRTEFAAFGILVHDLEERGQPQISARALVADFELEPFRFFLDDPAVFHERDRAASERPPSSD